MRRLAMLVAFCVIGAGAFGAWWWWQQQGGASVAESRSGKGKGKGAGGPLVVKATRAVAKPMPVLIEAVGTVEPEHSVQVRAQVSGVLQSVLFKEGDTVKAGQLLFQIDPRTFEAAYRQSQAQLARDQAQLENAKVQQERLEPLLKREFITRQEFDVAVTSVKSLEATVAADRALMEQARIQLEFARIQAPIAGRTGALAVKSGNLVAAGAGSGGVPLVTINSRIPFWSPSASRSASWRSCAASRSTRRCGSRFSPIATVPRLRKEGWCSSTTPSRLRPARCSSRRASRTRTKCSGPVSS